MEVYNDPNEIPVGDEQEPHPEASRVDCPYCGEPMECTGGGPSDQLDWTCSECGAWASFHAGEPDDYELSAEDKAMVDRAVDRAGAAGHLGPRR